MGKKKGESGKGAYLGFSDRLLGKWCVFGLTYAH